MLRLMLLRHAKAERSPPGGSDIERRLDNRGRHDAPLIGAYLLGQGLLPDAAVVSPAARTRETWELVAAALKTPPHAEFDQRLYDATPEAILDVVRDTRRNAAALLVVAHNPGLQELAVSLIASGDPDGRERLSQGMPTCALAVIDFTAQSWTKLAPRDGRLERFVTPKQLASSDD